MIGIPSHIYRDDAKKRLNYYSLATLLLLTITSLALAFKIYFTITCETIQEL